MTQNYHICFINSGVYSYLTDKDVVGAGGAERQQYLIGSNLASRGHKITYLTGRYTGPAKESIGEFDVVKRIPMEGGYSGAPKKFVQMLNALREINADVYYCRAEALHYILTTLFCKVFQKPIVYSVAGDHHVEPQKLRQRFSLLYRRTYEQSMRWTDKITTLTEYQKDILRVEHGLDAKVVPVGYDLPPKKELRTQTERSDFLWIGRIARDNNPLAFLEAAKNLDELSFIMGGPASEDGFSQSIIEKAQSLDNVKYVGFIKPKEVHHYFRDAKGFIQTTRTTSGFGNTTLEAWRYATPVISLHSNFDGRIINCNLGFYSEGSVEKLKRGVEILNENQEMRQNLGWNGRRFLQKNFLIEDVIDAYESIFSELIKNE